jgi:polysaccharide biosynthesis protein PslF
MNTGQSLHIAILYPCYPPSEAACGIGEYSEKSAEELLRHGCRVTIITSTRYRGPSLNNGVRVVRLAEKFGWCEARAVGRLWKEMRFDLLCLQYAPARYDHGFCVGLGLLALRRPVSLILHTVYGGGLASKLRILPLLKTARQVVSTNEEVSYLIRKWRLRRKSLYEIPIAASITPPVKAESRESARAALNLPLKTFIIAAFGLFYPGKGFETLLKACALLRADLEDFRLFFIGDPDGADLEYAESIRAMSAGLGLTDRVLFTGYLEKTAVSRHFTAADVCALPFDRGASFRRSSLMAALAHGLPVVTTFPGLASPLLESGAVSLVPSLDPRALADRLLELSRNPAERGRLSESSTALNRVFQWPAIGERLYRSFLEILQEHP